MKSGWILILAVLALLSACDKSDCPYADERLCDEAYRDSVDNIGGNDTLAFVEIDQTELNAYEKKVILEEFTGFRCTNCLPATTTANNLAEQWGERLVLIAYHSTQQFAAPIASPPEPFSTDFRTPEGEQFVTTFQVPGLPNGMINRTEYSGNLILGAGSWAERVAEAMADPVQAFLKISDINANEQTGAVSFKVSVLPLDPSIENMDLVVGIYEDDLTEAQKDGNETIFPYTHNHVFRGNVNGLYGQPSVSPEINFEGNKARLHSFNASIEPDWNLDHCHLFAYLHNPSTGEIIQSEEISIMP